MTLPQCLEANSVKTSKDVWLGFHARPGPSVIKMMFLSRISFHGQDLSLAGNQSSMQGTRTVLVKEIFRIWDERKAIARPLNLE